MKKGFFRSKSEGTYTGVGFFGDIIEGQKYLKVSHLNSGIKFSPSVELYKDDLTELLEHIETLKRFERENLIIDATKGDIYIGIKYEGTEYEFTLDVLEGTELFYLLTYYKNYLYSEAKIDNLESVNSSIEVGDDLGSYVTRNFIETSTGEQKMIYIPRVEEGIHHFKDKNTTSYYFKFFPQYLDNWLRYDNQKKEGFSGNKYPFQLIVQSNGKSEVFTFSLKEFILVKMFIVNPEVFSKHLSLNEYLINSGILHQQSSYEIQLENNYKGKKYLNSYVLNKHDFDKIKTLFENNKHNEVLQHLQLFKKEGKIPNNSFIAFDMIPSIKFAQKNFLNFKLARSNEGEIDNRSSIFQLSTNLDTNETLVNLIKGDLSSGGIKFETAHIPEDQYCSLKYKLEVVQKFITEPELLHKSNILNNLMEKNSLGEKLNDSDSLHIKKAIKIPNEFHEIFPMVNNESINVNINIYYSHLFGELNGKLLSQKKLDHMRYPVTMYINDNEGNKVTNFKLDFAHLIMLKDFIDGKSSSFIITSKASNTYKKFRLDKLSNGEVQLRVGTSMKSDFSQIKITANHRFTMNEEGKNRFKTVFQKVFDIEKMFDTAIFTMKAENYKLDNFGTHNL